MNQTYNKTFVASKRNPNETVNIRNPTSQRNLNETYETTSRRIIQDRTYDMPPQVNKTYNKSSGRERINKTYDVEEEEDLDESSSFDFVQEDDFSTESPTPTFESSESSSYDVQSFSKFGVPNKQSTPHEKLNLDLLKEFDGLGPIMKKLEERLEKSTRTQLGQTFNKSSKLTTPTDRTWAIFVDDMNKDHTKRSKSTPRRATTSPKYYETTPTRSRGSPSHMTSRQNKMVARKLDFSNPVNDQLHFSNRMSVTRTEPNGCSITFTRTKSGPDVSVLNNRDC